jgi:hypothetical protein
MPHRDHHARPPIWTVLAPLAVATIACVPGNDSPGGLAGTYLVSGESNVTHGDGGEPERTAIAGETVTVTQVGRQYQGRTYEALIGGCKLEGGGEGVSSTRISTSGCKLGGLDVRGGGAIIQKGAEIDVYLTGTVLGDAGTVGSFDYRTHGVPKR